MTYNKKIRYLLKKGQKYIEPWKINFFKALIEIITALNKCIKAMTIKTKYTTSNFKSLKEKVLGITEN